MVNIQLEKVNESNVNRIIDEVKNKKTLKTYIINHEGLDSFLKRENKTIVYFYARWCKPCKSELPEFLNLIAQDSSLVPILIATDKISEFELNENYLKNLDVNFPTFIVSEEYSSKVSYSNRYVSIRNKICSNCQDIIGFPSIIVLDNKNVIYKKSGNIDLDHLKKLLKE